MVPGEVDGLAVVRSLTGGLEEEPLLRLEGLVGAAREADFVVRVVAFHQVEDDGRGLPEREVGVGIVDRWEAAIGVDLGVFFSLDVGDGDEDWFVWEAEFFEGHCDFGRVGPADAVEFDWLELGRHGRSLLLMSI